MTILCDSREHMKQYARICAGFDELGVRYVRTKLLVGDYQNMDNAYLVVDRKHNLSEVAGNFCEDRFVKEMKIAHQLGIKIVFLVEHGGKIRTIEDVLQWKNPRLKESPLALSGERIYKKMLAFQNYYGVEFRFCDKRKTAQEIVRILGGTK